MLIFKIETNPDSSLPDINLNLIILKSIVHYDSSLESEWKTIAATRQQLASEFCEQTHVVVLFIYLTLTSMCDIKMFSKN